MYVPNRIIKESINDSRGLSRCSLFAEDLYKRLLTYADDYGRFNADTEIMLARLYPREVLYVSEEDLADALSELAGEDKIAFYTSRVFHAGPKKGGSHIGVYGCFPNWAEHQRVRDSKKRCPDPDDTDINDWYLRRFVPIDMRAELIERAGFKCQECGKYITSCSDAKRFVKLGSGLYHIDHVVPCSQGGRATFENLRVTCPECNLKRKRKFTFNEILEFTIANSSENADGNRNSPQFAANCGKSPPESESESESKKEKEKIARAREEMPFGLTDEDIRNSLLIDQQIENAARSIGLQVSEAGMEYGRRLAHEYGLDVLIESIKKAVDVPKWKYVEGICKGSGSKPNEPNDNRGHHSGLQSAGGEKSGKYASLFDDSI